VKCPYKEEEEDASVVIFNATWTRNPIGLNNTKELKKEQIFNKLVYRK
jgi:hypothetical protein